MTNEIEQRTVVSRFAKAEVSCFYESEVLNSRFVYLMKFNTENSSPLGRQKVVNNPNQTK